MSISNNSRLRHDLRTPINHLLGYSQLLLEDFESEGGDAEWKSQIHKVVSLAKEMLQAIETVLPRSEDEVDEERLVELRRTLEEPLQQITMALQSISLPAGAPQSADIQKLYEASRKLMNFCRVGSLEKSSHQPPLKAVPGETKMKPRGARLLLVDDDLANREAMERMLQRMGHEVFLASDGASALSLVKNNRYDVVLLDILMPGLSGYEVLRDLKSLAPRLPVIMITAVGEVESLADCIELGAEDYFLKPFEPKLLRARISAILNRVRQQPGPPSASTARTTNVSPALQRELEISLRFVINFVDLAKDTLVQLRPVLGPSDDTVESLLVDLAQSLASARKHAGRADQALSQGSRGSQKEETL